MKNLQKIKLAVFGCGAFLSMANPLDAAQINLTLTGNASADAGFASAAAYIESQFSDTGVEVNITAGFANLGAGILGSAGST